MNTQILVVCTGNICRSPVGQGLLEQGLGDLPGVRIDSAGTHAVVGSAPVPESLDFLSPRMDRPLAHAGTQLDRSLAEASDLILTMTADHRALVAATAPRTVRRTFTMRELAAILPLVDLGAVRDLPGLLDAAARLRSRVPAEEIDIFDPINGPADGYGRSYAMVADAADRIIPALRPLLANPPEA